jgi:hypothetical protein
VGATAGAEEATTVFGDDESDGLDTGGLDTNSLGMDGLNPDDLDTGGGAYPAVPDQVSSRDAALETGRLAEMELPLPDPTGDERVDAALARFAELGGAPVADHVEIFEDVQRRLQDVLVSIDQER